MHFSVKKRHHYFTFSDQRAYTGPSSTVNLEIFARTSFIAKFRKNRALLNGEGISCPSREFLNVKNVSFDPFREKFRIYSM